MYKTVYLDSILIFGNLDLGASEFPLQRGIGSLQVQYCLGILRRLGGDALEKNEYFLVTLDLPLLNYFCLLPPVSLGSV